MAIDKFVVGRTYTWGSYNSEYDYFVVSDVSEDTLYYRYPNWDNGSDHVHKIPLQGVSLSEVLLVTEENNQLSPNVYQFPNGVEVKDISAHLTSFGGQAVQYIARATRLDGVVKGLPIQDLYKAIELLKWEAERLEALQK